MRIIIATVLFWVVLISADGLNAQQAPQVIMEQEKAVAVSFKIEGNPEAWQVFREGSRRPLVGKKELRNDSLFFYPLISFQPGLKYLVKKLDKAVYEFRVPEKERSKPRLVHIYPSATDLPANLLKFYIRFSEPMAEGNPYGSLHLLNAKGDTLREAFLKQMPALWNRDRTILSLWLDPGRIKRDLELNKRMGAPLQENQSYSLVIDKNFKSREGEPLQAAAQKEFRTITADRSKPSVKDWMMVAPGAGTAQPLIIRFPEAMDYLSAEGRIEILAKGVPVSGTSSFRDDEKEWVFKPAEAWRKGEYMIQADARIEDLAGNNLNQLFDRDTKKQPLSDNLYYIMKIEIR